MSAIRDNRRKPVGPHYLAGSRLPAIAAVFRHHWSLACRSAVILHVIAALALRELRLRGLDEAPPARRIYHLAEHHRTLLGFGPLAQGAPGRRRHAGPGRTDCGRAGGCGADARYLWADRSDRRLNAWSVYSRVRTKSYNTSGGTGAQRQARASPCLPLATSARLTMLRAIFVMGASGAGKTTLSSVLSERLGIAMFQGGRLLRQMAGSATSAHARSAQKIIALGRPIPIELYRELISSSASVRGGSIIFDGYPRDVDQCSHIPSVLGAAKIPGAAVTGVFVLADTQTITGRLKRRKICRHCGGPWDGLVPCCSTPTPMTRPDDENLALIHKRMAFYDANAPRIRAHFTTRWPVFDVEPSQPDALTPLLSHLADQVC
jgi:adenylate kinase family enzyme